MFVGSFEKSVTLIKDDSAKKNFCATRKSRFENEQEMDLPRRSMCHFQVMQRRKTSEKLRKTINMTNERPSILPMIHGSGNGGQGSGLGQLPVQSTQEHVPLVFYNEMSQF